MKTAFRDEKLCNLILSTLKKRTESSSETLEPNYRIVWLRISEARNFHVDC
jgi:hypothetical protein